MWARAPLALVWAPRSYQRALARLSAHPLGHEGAFLDTAAVPLASVSNRRLCPRQASLDRSDAQPTTQEAIFGSAPHRLGEALDRSLPVSQTWGLLAAITKTHPWFQQNSPTAWWPLFRWPYGPLLLRRLWYKVKGRDHTEVLRYPDSYPDPASD